MVYSRLLLTAICIPLAGTSTCKFPVIHTVSALDGILDADYSGDKTNFTCNALPYHNILFGHISQGIFWNGTRIYIVDARIYINFRGKNFHCNEKFGLYEWRDDNLVDSIYEGIVILEMWCLSVDTGRSYRTTMEKKKELTNYLKYYINEYLEYSEYLEEIELQVCDRYEWQEVLVGKNK